MLLYVLARTYLFFQYRGTDLAELHPADCEMAVRVRDCQSLVNEGKLLKIFRDIELEAKLDEMNVNQNIQFIKDEFVASVIKESGKEKFLLTTRLGYLEFLALPILENFPSIIGAKSKDGVLIINRSPPIALTFLGNIALVSNDQSLFKRSYGSLELKKEKRVHMKAHPKNLKELNLFLPQLEGEKMIDISIDLNERQLELEVEIPKGNLTGVDINISNYSTEDCAFVGNVTVNGLELWKLLRKAVVNKNMKVLLDEIANSGLENDFLPLLKNGFGFVSRAHDAKGLRRGKFIAACVIVSTHDPFAAFNKLDKCVKTLFSQYGDFFKEGNVYYFKYRPDPVGISDILMPAYAMIDNKIFFSNNPDFLKDLLFHRKKGLINSADFKEASKHLPQLLDQNVKLTGFMESARFFESLTGYATIIAQISTPTNELSRKIREQKKREFAIKGKHVTDQELNEIVKEEIRKIEREHELAVIKELEVLKFFKWAGYVYNDSKLTMKISLN